MATVFPALLNLACIVLGIVKSSKELTHYNSLQYKKSSYAILISGGTKLCVKVIIKIHMENDMTNYMTQTFSNNNVYGDIPILLMLICSKSGSNTF